MAALAGLGRLSCQPRTGVGSGSGIQRATTLLPGQLRARGYLRSERETAICLSYSRKTASAGCASDVQSRALPQPVQLRVLVLFEALRQQGFSGEV